MVVKPTSSGDSREQGYIILGDPRLPRTAINYSQFVPNLYNYCSLLGFPAPPDDALRAFCSDKSKGYPVILIP
jgi:hypothetical protein